MKNNGTRDKAGKDYWDSCWEEHDLPDALDPRLGGLKNLYNQRVDDLFREIFADMETKNKRILEVGCAMSVFLPYLAKEIGFEKAGMKVGYCEYFLSNGFGMANVNGLDQSRLSTKVKRNLIRNMGRLSVLSWALENKTFRLPNTKLFSPYIVCVAEK